MIYQWPKGRVARTAMLVILVIVGIDLSVSASGQLANYFSPESEALVGNLVTGLIYAIAAIAAFLGGIIGTLFHPKSSQFLIEVEREMLSVTWPKWNEIVRSTIVIGILTAILGVLIFGVDSFNFWFFHQVVLGVRG